MYTIRKFPRWILVVAALGVVYCIMGVAAIRAPSKIFPSSVKGGVSALRDDQEFGTYYKRTWFVQAGQLPYAQNRIEYPALGVAYLSLPHIFTSEGFDGYRNGLIAINVVAAIVLVYVSGRLVRLFSKRLVVLWLFALPSVLYFSVNRFDVFPALLVQWSLYLLLRHKFKWAFVLLSVSFLAKGYSIILFPVFLMYYLNVQKRELRPLRNMPLWVMVVPAVILVGIICLWSGLENGLFPYIFQSTRNFAYGSVYAIYIGALYTLMAHGVWSFCVKIFSHLLTLMQYIVPIVIYAGHMIFRKFIVSKQDVVNWSLLLLLLYMLFSVYYSPQWIIWVLPFFILYGRSMTEFLVVLLYDLMNYLQYPFVWNVAGPQTTVFSIVVMVRTILLVILVYCVVARIIADRRSKQITNPGSYVGID